MQGWWGGHSALAAAWRLPLPLSQRTLSHVVLITSPSLCSGLGLGLHISGLTPKQSLAPGIM